MPQEYEIEVTEDDRKFSAAEGANLLEALQEQGYELPSLCGGLGLCGKCRVKVLAGKQPPTESDRELFSEEELERGMRLSCRVEVEDDLVLAIPSLAQGKSEEATAKSDLDEQIVDVEPDSGIKRVVLDLENPGRGDQRSDANRITDEFEGSYSFPLDIMEDLPEKLRENDYSVTVTIDDSSGSLLSVEGGSSQYESYGMAFDIGTTTVAGYGLDLETGRTLNVDSRENPQGKFGADVVSRIKYVRENEDGLDRMQSEIIRAINELVQGFVDSRNIERKDIYRATFVGNNIMLHLLTGVDPTHLDQAPYIPAFTDPQTFDAEELGVKINSGGKIVLLPSLAGYVGADVMAGVLQTGMHKSDELNLLVDIGTNGEMVLGNRDKMYAASTAAGPAFEGANIEQGMTARAGAISHVSIDDEGQLELEVIGDKRPIGLCGSGIVDTVGELIKAGLIGEKGGIVSEKSALPRPTINPLGNRLIDMEGEKAFWLHVDNNPVFVTQQDVREVQLAKGAIKAGIEILLEEFGATAEEIDRVYLAGAFGNYLRKENIMRIGVLPRVDLDKIVSVGNAAGQGGKLALINRGKMDEVNKIARDVEYVELSFRSDFTEKFMSAMSFPEAGE
ncbi:ASKHA domain-containing protein [Candidatus Bipolaricaulota bacterium]|nr:ASKHA domain-containing protein [Candidatus Bipolaricaulota bacterium]